MAIPFLNLPQIQIRDPGLDTAPLVGALRNYQAGSDAAQKFSNQQSIGQTAAGGDLKAAARQAMGLGELDIGRQYQAEARVDEQTVKKRLASAAQAVELEQDPGRRTAMWQRTLKMIPGGAANLSPEEMDPMTGPKLLMAEAGIVVDPLDRQAKQSAIATDRLQQESARLDIRSKQRDIDQPKGVLTELDANKTLVYTDPRTGENKVIREPQSSSVAGPYKDPKQRADVEEGLRKEVTTAAKNYNVINESKVALESIAKQPNAATDIAMVFSFMKILDPDSVVRETEYAAAARAAGVPDRIAGVIERIQSGQILTPQQRQEFLGVARTLASARGEMHKKTLERYKGISERLGVDPRNVLPDDSQPNAPSPRQTIRGVPYRAQNAQGMVIESDDGVNWRPER